MTRLGPRNRLVIATHNPGKLREIAELIAPFGVEAVSAGDLGLPEPEETGSDFVENAVLKARAAAEAADLPALADDSGLEVAALDGAPGIYSARWAGPERDFRIAMERVERELAGQGTGERDRSAAFVCVLCLAWPGGEVLTFEGHCSGDLVWPPRGDQGFGYDPIFRPEGHDITFGEMAPAEKHRIDHRSRAFAQLVPAVFGATDG
jgi:XTP/dITP diphosphohydrolase